MRVERRRHCFDCRWLEIRLRLGGASYYWCHHKRLALRTSILGRRACKDFSPRRPLPRPDDH
ncbi:MAG: hypothetical protein HY553_07250 [Elusimicrobia bacterium]|nr:hypothetical protein [Elusimicrobiota bacterium]